MRAAAFAALLAVAELVPTGDARADEAVAVSLRRTQIEDRGPNRLLMATGGATFAFSYGVSAWVGATSPRESERFLLAPIVGPWIALGIREECGAPPAAPCDTETTYEGLLVASGALQLAGLAQIAFAFVKRERRDVDRSVLVPIAFSHGAGLGAIGAF